MRNSDFVRYTTTDRWGVRESVISTDYKKKWLSRDDDLDDCLYRLTCTINPHNPYAALWKKEICHAEKVVPVEDLL